MADQPPMLLDTPDDIALDDLCVITIEHDLDIGTATFSMIAAACFHILQKIAGLIPMMIGSSNKLIETRSALSAAN